MARRLWRGSGPLRRIVALVGGIAWSAAAWAVCTCGYGDGRFTLAPISVDGNLADWAPVHADIDNNVCDGPSGGLADRDAPVQSTGRDLTHFAYTWDQNNIYLFTERFGSASNQQSFVYYADVDNDALMETGEPVIGVTWRGNNRRINVYVFTYVSQAAGGDPMVDGSGYGDGHTLPGSFANVPPTGSPNRSGVWGSVNGLQMEFFVTWAELGLAPNTPFTFHVSSSNASLGASSFAQQVDDNLSGCGGGLGSTAVRDVTLIPDRSLNALAGQTVVATHTLTNTGNAIDYFDVAWSTSGDFVATVALYEDVNGDGEVGPGDTLLTDSDGDGDPDTRVLAAGEAAALLIEYTPPAGAGVGDAASITMTASSDAQPLANDTVTDTVTVVAPPNLVIDKQPAVVTDPVNLNDNPHAIPGSEIRYAIQVRNEGAGIVDQDSIVIGDALPAEICMRVTDVAGPGSGPVEFTDGVPSSGLTYTFVAPGDMTDDLDFSDDGGLTYGYVPTPNAQGCDPAVTNIRITPRGVLGGDDGTGAPNAQFSFHAIVD